MLSEHPNPLTHHPYHKTSYVTVGGKTRQSISLYKSNPGNKQNQLECWILKFTNFLIHFK